MTDVVLITEQSHPSIFKAFETISHDCGRQAGHKNYAIPMEFESGLADAEARLKYLLENADLDFECLCIGESEERDKIVIAYGLNAVDNLLEDFSEEFRR